MSKGKKDIISAAPLCLKPTQRKQALRNDMEKSTRRQKDMFQTQMDGL